MTAQTIGVLQLVPLRPEAQHELEALRVVPHKLQLDRRNSQDLAISLRPSASRP